MKRLLATIGLLVSLHAGAACNPPFVSQTILSAAALNNAIMNPCIVSGSLDSVTITNSSITGATGSFTTLTSPLVSITGGLIDGTKIGSGTPSTGAFSTLASPSVTLTGGTINSVSVGATTPSTGAFSTLSASGAVSGIGFSTYLASPPAIGGTAPAAIAGTTITANTSAAVGSGVTGGVFQAYTGGGHFSLYSGAVTPGAGNYGLTINDTQSFINGSGAGGSYMEYNGTPVVSVTGASSTSVAGTLSATTFSGAGTSLTGTAASLTAGNATTAATATNVAGGTQWGVLYQSAVGTTASTAAGTSGFVLTSNGTAAPTFQSAGSPYNPAAVAITGGNISGITSLHWATGGATNAGSIYSDANWGGVLRALTASPIIADWDFQNSAGTSIARLTTTTATFPGTVSAVSFSGAGTGLTGTAPGLNIGGNATTVGGIAAPTRTADVTPLPSGYITVAHGLGHVPYIATLEIVCLTAEFGYSVGDAIQGVVFYNGSYYQPGNVWSNATYVGINSAFTAYRTFNKTTGAGFQPTPANWAYRFVVQ